MRQKKRSESSVFCGKECHFRQGPHRLSPLRSGQNGHWRLRSLGLEPLRICAPQTDTLPELIGAPWTGRVRLGRSLANLGRQVHVPPRQCACRRREPSRRQPTLVDPLAIDPSVVQGVVEFVIQEGLVPILHAVP